MKKIVALVLSLVMVLGLATVAFADETTTTLKAADGYDVYAIDGTVSVKMEKKDITMKVTGNVSVTDSTGTTVTYTSTTYAFTNILGTTSTLAEVDASCATHKLVKGTAVVAYLFDSGAAVQTTDVVDASVKSVKDAVKTCGDYVNANEYTVYVIDDKAYFADGTTANNWALLNGKFVALGASADTSLVKHNYAANTYSASVENGVTTVKCNVCKNVYDVLTKDQVKGMAPTAYTTWNNLYVATGVAAPVVDAGDKVESAETFDAGIAMYVGMSVMAAAGSAVVLKKKD